MLLITANDIFIFQDISVETYKALSHRLLIVDSKNCLKNISLYCLFAIPMSFFMAFISFAEKYNVKICSFGYRLGPTVITLGEPDTMFLVKRS